MKRTLKRLTALLLSLAMAMSLLQVTALAAESEAVPEEEAAVETLEEKRQDTAELDSEQSEMPVIPYEEQRSGVWTYTISSFEVTITGYDGNESSVVIPSELAGYPVTAINRCVFQETAIRSVTIPTTIEHIGSYAFENCKYLQEINFNAKDCTVDTGIFNNAGKNVSSLVVTFGSQVTKIPDYMFYSYDDNYARVTSVKMSNSIKTIGRCAFERCADLSDVTWGTGIEEIKAYAFSSCKLTDVSIPANTNTIESYAFIDCKYMQKINYDAKDCSVQGEAFKNAGKNVNSLAVTFGSHVAVIPSNLFYAYDKNSAYITSVVIPGNVQEIGKGAFADCYNLKKVTIKSKTVKFPEYEGNNPFAGCDKSQLVFECYHNSTTQGFASKNGYKIKYLDVAIAAPKLTGVANSSKGIQVKWNQVSGANGYRVFRKAGSSKSWKAVATVNASTSAYVDKNVSNGTKYVYTVRPYAKNSAGTTWGKYNSKGLTIIRLATSKLSSAKSAKAQQMTLKWARNSKASGYQVQYATNSKFSGAKAVKISGNKNVSRTISKLAQGKRYYVRVRSYRTYGGKNYCSGWSNVRYVTIQK